MIDSKSLTVCIDFKNPEAYLSWAPTCAFARQQNIKITWLPFVGPHPKIPEPVKMDHAANRGTLHRRKRFEYRQQNIMRYSANLNLDPAALNRQIDSDLAALGLLWCTEVSQLCTTRFIDYVFSACWQKQYDISDLNTIRDAIAHAEADVKQFDAFANGSGPRKLAELHQELKQNGVFDTPFYLLQGEGFLGRQHLPMIAWIWSKKQTVKPI